MSGETEALSPFQMECLQLLTKGFSNREISQRMNCSIDRIRKQTRMIFSIMGCDSRLEAAVIATKEGLA